VCILKHWVGVTRLIIFVSVLQSACMVGPNFLPPAPPKVTKFTESPMPLKTVQSPGPGGQAQAFHPNEDIPLLWWELFHSPAINQLISRGLANSPNLAAAAATLRQAQENLNVFIGNNLWPAFDASGYAERIRFSEQQIGLEATPAITFNLFYASVNVVYTLDFFGGARREIESLRAKVNYEQFELIAAYLTLTANIVTTSINIASYQAQIETTLKLIKTEQAVLDILRKQFRLGGVSGANVLTQQTLVEQTRATLPPLQRSLSQAKHTLSVLIGVFPECPLPEIRLENLRLPTNIPVSFPANIVRQRPDVLASEALLHSACAEIGVATANLFPKFTINGTYGWLSNKIQNLFSSKSYVWDIIGEFTQPIFHGGALFAQRRANVAAYQQAAAQYHLVVLQAFQNVADVLRALETDARTFQADMRAEESARRSFELTLGQYRLGGATYINLLIAQQQYRQAQIARIQAQATRYSDTAALFQALGGGWWHKPWCIKL
jgi:NodT family efflux transporter outer membrane factor (OMF) lipoprotein